ncbi:hypothetical protein M885DRAFT_579541, partial [Pelagophyceae sp. CCMP2097]
EATILLYLREPHIPAVLEVAAALAAPAAESRATAAQRAPFELPQDVRGANALLRLLAWPCGADDFTFANDRDAVSTYNEGDYVKCARAAPREAVYTEYYLECATNRPSLATKAAGVARGLEAGARRAAACLLVCAVLVGSAESQRASASDVAILMVAAAGHLQWREAWRRDPRNGGGCAPRYKFGENIDVPYERLTHAENRCSNLRAAEHAVGLVLRDDLDEDDRLHLLHEG